MRARSLLVVLVVSAHAWADDNITVVRKTLPLAQEHQLLVDRSMEYILQFVPSKEQSRFPMRLRLESDAGDVTHPLLITARQRTGAITWQLPYHAGDSLVYRLERTLCPDSSLDAGLTDCAGEEEMVRAGEFSVHVASSCAVPAGLRLRADPAEDWDLAHKPAPLTVTMSAPRVSRYEFAEEEASVRLVVASQDDTCATVAVHHYTCPIPQTVEAMEQTALRMTVQRSGGVQLSRAQFGRGFYVIALVGESDAACSAEQGAEGEAAGEGKEWLWEAAVGGETDGEQHRAPSARRKDLTYEIKPSLSRRQYLVGTAVALALFLLFYVAFGVLVLAERWPRWYNLVRPLAVLQDPHKSESAAMSELPTAADGASAPARRRRGSTATFDSSDASDSDSEDEATTATTTVTTAADVASPPPADAAAVPGANGQTPTVQILDEVDGTTGVEERPPPRAEAGARPFGLPARLALSALARRRARVLRARSQRYLYTLYTVAVFYALPVLQFVTAFQLILNVSGSLDLCYYNFLCAHPLGALSDFNHVYSNLGYLLLGALFMLQIRRRKMRRERHPRDEEYGIPAHYGLSSSLGAGMMVVALLSASYHVCPNRLNFQFDTAFMYVLAVLSMVKIYQSRHPDINARSHATFAVLAGLIALVVWGVLGGGPLFWSVFTVLHVFTFLLLSLRIYYVGQFRLEKESLAEAARALAARPLYTARLVALLLANAVNWAFAIYGLVNQSADIASHLLFVLLCNTLLYIAFYLSMKLVVGERVRWYAWLHLAGAACAWAPALYWFTSGSTDWAAGAARSRHLNHECRALAFYDAHDLWHMLSAVALYLTFNLMLTWDDGLAAVKRSEIAVF